MVVCHRRKIIFVHIPKTGGTSVEEMLTDYGMFTLEFHGVLGGRALHHFTAIELMSALGKNMFNNYYKFAFVRNPYEKMVSEYYWCRIPGVGFRNKQSFNDFIKYVENIVKNKKFYTNIYHDHFIPQYYFIFNNKQLLVNDVYKFEDIKIALPLIKEKLKIRGPILHTNKNRFKSNADKLVLTDEQKEKIYNLYKIDFDVFNYNKDYQQNQSSE
jgi:hypothetical protein